MTEWKVSPTESPSQAHPRMTRDEILEVIVGTMAELFELSRTEITPAADLRRDLGLDSIDAVDMAVRLRELTGKKVPLSDLVSIQTVSDVVDLVERHLTDLDAEGEHP